LAKTRAQRKAERRKREQSTQRPDPADAREAESRAQHATQVPESADVVEAELAERGPAPEDLVPETDVLGQELPAPAPSRSDSARAERRRQKAEEKEERKSEDEKRKRAEAKRKAGPSRRQAEVAEPRPRGAVISFLISSWAELKRVQWPDRETLIQATAVTVVFISVAAAYLGVLDTVFNWLIKRIL
jgi:preprotein translocase SecE subunit